MQYQAASNTHYAVLSSFQNILLSLLHSIYCICTISQSYLSTLYSIALCLGHWTNIFYFYILRTLKYHNFLNIYPIETKKKVGKLKNSSIL